VDPLSDKGRICLDAQTRRVSNSVTPRIAVAPDVAACARPGMFGACQNRVFDGDSNMIATST
jgi:hypothetical protein